MALSNLTLFNLSDLHFCFQYRKTKNEHIKVRVTRNARRRVLAFYFYVNYILRRIFVTVTVCLVSQQSVRVLMKFCSQCP